MAISRMQEPRQLYGLGSLVKSIGKTIKKVVKSPIGKAAVLGLGGYALGGGFGPGGFAFRNIPGFTGAKNLLMGKPLGFKTAGDAVARSGGILDIGKKFLGSTAGQVGIGAALSALAASGMDQEEIAEIENDPEKLRIYLKDYYSKTNPDASGAEIEEFVRINSATGGRIGFNEGTNMKMAMSDDANERLLEKIYEDLLDEGFSPEEAAKKAREEFERQAIAIGGRVGLEKGTPKPKFDEEEYFRRIAEEDRKSEEDEDYIRKIIDPENMAIGGRVGLESGTPKKGLESISIKDLPLIKGPYMIKYDKDGNPVKFPKPKGEPYRYDPEKEIPKRLLRNKSAMGGLQSMPTGIMRKNKAGTIERDYRETGGFVPVGIKEKADDVPAMLSKNEFVMTADAVRGIGDGNIEKGAQRLYDQMKTAEKRVV